tara:strand:- start:123 stop:434 length:312 start_codon:yes stop_codon:yes gene_type:complete
MRHHLKIVAKNFQVDEKKLTEFALANPKSYGIEAQGDFVTTSTLFSEILIEDFKSKPLRLYSKQHDSYCTWNGMAYSNDGKVSGAYFYGLEKAKNNGFEPIKD